MGTRTGDVGIGEVGHRTQGLGDVELGVVGLGDMGRSDPWRLGDLINKPDF